MLMRATEKQTSQTRNASLCVRIMQVVYQDMPMRVRRERGEVKRSWDEEAMRAGAGVKKEKKKEDDENKANAKDAGHSQVMFLSVGCLSSRLHSWPAAVLLFYFFFLPCLLFVVVAAAPTADRTTSSPTPLPGPLLACRCGVSTSDTAQQSGRQ